MPASQIPFNPKRHCPGSRPCAATRGNKRPVLSREQPDDTPKDQRIPGAPVGGRQMA